jgi:hypothetical protein
MIYSCEICNQHSFELKINYEKHKLMCFLRHQSHKEKQNKIESIPPKLTLNELTKLVMHLIHKNEKLESRLKKAEDNIANFRKREKTTILQTLNLQEKKPDKTFKEWIKKIPISICHLEIVFQTDLIQGILLWLKDAVLSTEDISNLPFCSFVQKPKTLFVYSEDTIKEKKWKVISSEEIKKIANSFGYRFLRTYLHSNKSIREKYSEISDIEWKEKDMMFTNKIMGEDICENTRMKKIQEACIDMVQRDLETI